MYKKHLFFFVILWLLVGLLLEQKSAFAQEKTLKKKPKIGLVLSGGGARGFAHIGVIKVLEEQGIDVDIIGGTSMGAVVGGLYAMGYTIQEIEEIAVSQEWGSVLNDAIDRKNLGVFEKFDNEIHILSLSIINKKISIPAGLVYGQNVTNLLTKLTGPVYQTQNFKDLNKPFLCMATDLLSGTAIKLDTGNLATAIRASMSVPSAFVPAEYGPYYLVDGGLINNFPAEEVRDMGADVLIGIDIQTPLFKQDEITNLVEVLSQSIFLNAEDVFNENTAQIDLLIKPEIAPYTAMDFNRADSLILRGERKAREMIPQIQAFMDSIGITPSVSIKKYNAFPDLDMIYVDNVIINGNEKVTDRYLLSVLNIDENGQISTHELNNKINHLYGTKLFHTINYSLDYADDGKTTIIINVLEASKFSLNVGAHYNDYAKAGLLLNLTGRNFGAPNGRLSVDLVLGKVDRLTVQYVIDNGFKPGVGGLINIFNQHGFVYDEDGKKMISYDMAVFSHKGFGLITYKNIALFQLGYELESNRIQPGVSIIDFDKLNNLSGNLYAQVLYDTYDRVYLPMKGYRLFAKATIGGGENTDIQENAQGGYYYPKEEFSYSTIDLFGSWVIPISKHFVLKPEIYYRKNFGNGIPITKTAYFGGFSNTYISSYLPFPGYEFMQLSGHTAFYPQLTIRHHLWESHFLSFQGRFLSLDLVLDNPIKENEFYYGWEVKYTYYSLIGPISVSMAEAYPRKALVFDFSLGFWF
ncbi:MAG: hypothetical protein B7C24_00110 [Bacteroidetes bacterium 4572_77]|nr:MAG: hypothetical protein B7C24_00110 [Bacteroidetes bacterium 4572_77]